MTRIERFAWMAVLGVGVAACGPVVPPPVDASGQGAAGGPYPSATQAPVPPPVQGKVALATAHQIRRIGGKVIVVRLDAPPQARVRCALDRISGVAPAGGQRSPAGDNHAEMEWDPLALPALSQSVRVTKAEWRPSCAADPLPVAVSGAVIQPSYAPFHLKLDDGDGTADSSMGLAWSTEDLLGAFKRRAEELDKSAGTLRPSGAKKMDPDEIEQALRTACKKLNTLLDAERRVITNDSPERSAQLQGHLVDSVRLCQQAGVKLSAETPSARGYNPFSPGPDGAFDAARDNLGKVAREVATSPDHAAWACKHAVAQLGLDPHDEEKGVDARALCRVGRALLEASYTTPGTQSNGISAVRVTFSSTDEAAGARTGQKPRAMLSGDGSALARRSFELASVGTAATELLTILAEVAVERAKAQGFEVVAGEIRKIVCDELIWRDDLRTSVLGLPKLSSEAPAEKKRLLPRTCASLKQLRLQEIASTAEVLSQNVIEDLLGIASDVFLQQLATLAPKGSGIDKLGSEGLSPVFSTLLRVLLDSAVHKRAVSTRELQTIVSTLATTDWARLFADGQALECSSTPKDVRCLLTCGLELGFSVLEECTQQGGCSSARITDLVSRPTDLFEVGSCKETVETLATEWPDLATLVVEADSILHATERDDPKALAGLTVRLLFQIAEKRICFGEGGQACSNLRDVREAAEGLLAGKAHQVIVPVTSILARAIVAARKDTSGACKNAGSDECLSLQEELEDYDLTLNKISRVIAAFASYAATYSSSDAPSTERTKELHEARKKAIESVIDAFTDRTGLGGRWIVSLGANAGLVTGGQVLDGVDGAQAVWPQLSVPMGLAMQKLPEEGKMRNLSWHLQVSPIDLGQFVAMKEDGTIDERPEPGNFACLCFQAGLLFGAPTSSIFVGVDLRWIPTLDFQSGNEAASSGGVFRFGGSVSYYVPFLDLWHQRPRGVKPEAK